MKKFVPNVNAHYLHVDGGVYKVLSIGVSTVDQTQQVTYQHLYPFKQQVWVRPLDEWVDTRFTELTQSEYEELLRNTTALEYQQQVTNNKMNRKRAENS